MTLPLRFGIQLQPRQTNWHDYLEAVQLIEGLGFDTIWNFDHLLAPAGAPSDACLETWTTLAAMAASTSSIGVGSLVNGVLYRDPGTLAKSAATLDQISSGRLQFALGAAWAEREFHAFGLPFPPLAERLARLEEALSVVIMLWTKPTATFGGQYYTLEDALCQPGPLQRPYPKIMVGGMGRKTMRLVAQYADCWNGIGTPDEIEGAVTTLRQTCGAVGRDFSSIELSLHSPQLVIAPTKEEAEERARTMASELGITDQAELERWIVGSPVEVIDRIQEYLALGITHIIPGIGSPFDLAGLRLFAKKVMPAFRSLRVDHASRTSRTRAMRLA